MCSTRTCSTTILKVNEETILVVSPGSDMDAPQRVNLEEGGNAERPCTEIDISKHHWWYTDTEKGTK